MPVPLRSDFDAAAVRALARRTKDGPQARRLLTLAAVYDGASRTEAARIGGVGLQIVRDWVVKFNERGPDGLINGKAPGQPSRLDDGHRAALKAQLEAGPIPAVHGVVRWRLIDLMAWLWEEFRVTISKQTLSRELRAMNYRKLSARPRHHAKSEAAVEAFKKILLQPFGGDREIRGERQGDRDLVRRRGPHRPEEQDYTPVGAAWHPPLGPQGPEDGLRLHLRGDLPGQGRRRRLGPAQLHDRGHELASEGDCAAGRA